MDSNDSKKYVEGIGGVFFRSGDPKKLAEWYEKYFGIDVVGGGQIWKQKEGPTVFSPFEEKTEYFGDINQQFMINFRIKDLDKFIEMLKREGVKIDEKREDSEYGRFAWVYDIEGNKIELWEVPNK